MSAYDLPAGYDQWLEAPYQSEPKGFSLAEDVLGLTVIIPDSYDEDTGKYETGVVENFELCEDEDEDGWHSCLMYEVKPSEGGRSIWLQEDEIKEAA